MPAPSGNEDMKIANWVMSLVFLLCVAVQYNDPDPVRWMTIYGLAMAACLLFVSGKLRWPFPVAVGVATLLWAASIVPHLIGKSIPMNEVFGTMRMISEPVEEAREMGGLLIVSVWMLILLLALRKQISQPRSS